MDPDNPLNKSPEENSEETPDQQAMSDALKKMADNLGEPKINSTVVDKKESDLGQAKIEIAWEKVLSKFPPQLQKEFEMERPNPTQEDVEAYESLQLLNFEPQTIALEQLLKNNEDAILRCSPDVIEEINKKWGTKFDTSLSKVYDQNPGRVREYSRMPAETADPSVIADGEIMFGTGRFIAALLRKDIDLKVWNLSRKK